ncbi:MULTISPECIES: hypothetical protein [unclassified Tolypothrix]|nr:MULTISPECIES: hypothetical protein [unclassified Tolypothrix]BAY92917.1 hypothetical protein NIES3275_49540 [Microchaete diplosiphon NIES-3275]EKF03024.1 hypothetical protein FDUTEX481_05827 [Tolypothrix sp. PCC 7601]MBE9086612.1 hypothetical protein [Tolypothrix sp. LEGE 11397]UYD26819.1 hypothetical protein HGR01_01515 [Tolypothrix sp. PCC 7712]UYD37323.1 hypothetical protein HG267_17300 [Tolypothrix sp. PCC 7601]
MQPKTFSMQVAQKFSVEWKKKGAIREIQLQGTKLPRLVLLEISAANRQA